MLTIVIILLEGAEVGSTESDEAHLELDLFCRVVYLGWMYVCGCVYVDVAL